VRKEKLKELYTPEKRAMRRTRTADGKAEAKQNAGGIHHYNINAKFGQGVPFALVATSLNRLKAPLEPPVP